MREKVWGVGVAHLGSAYTRPAHTLSPDLVQRTERTTLRRSRTRGVLPEAEGVEENDGLADGLWSGVAGCSEA